MMRRTRRLALPLLLLAAAGCPAGGLRTGRPLSAAAAERLQPAITTKAQLLAMLGAPTAIAGRDEWVRAPAVSVRSMVQTGGAVDSFLVGGSYPLQGNALLELFADRGPLRDGHRVYYWAAARETGFLFVFIVFGGAEHYENFVDELYVLVDEEAERVEGVVFRPAAESGPRPPREVQQ